MGKILPHPCLLHRALDEPHMTSWPSSAKAGWAFGLEGGALVIELPDGETPTLEPGRASGAQGRRSGPVGRVGRWCALATLLASLFAVLSCAPFRKVNLQPTPSDVRPIQTLCKAGYGPSEQAGFGSPADLRGLTKVFVDVPPRPTTDEFKSRVAAAADDHRAQILSALRVAKLPLVVVSSREEAEVILAFCTNSLGPRCSFSTGSGTPSDFAAGEVYASLPAGLRLVMLYTDDCTMWNRELGKAFAEAFVQAHQVASRFK